MTSTGAPIDVSTWTLSGLEVTADSAHDGTFTLTTKQAVDATAGRSDAIADAKLAFGTLLARDETAANNIRSNLSTIT